MKHISITILFAILLHSISFSQIKLPVGTQSEINKFLKSKTYVVLKNDRMSDYNFVLKEAAEKHWKLTPYEFIYLSDFNNLKKDPANSFLMINQVYFEKDKTRTIFDFLILTIGGNYKSVDDMPTLCAIPLCYEGALESDYNYKIPIMLKYVQNHINTCKENPSLNEDNIAEYYMDKAGSPKKKTLYLLKKEMDPSIRSHNSFASSYPYNFEYTKEENISKLIENNDEHALILHKIGPKLDNTLSYCVKIIIDTKTGNIFYYDKHKMNKNKSDYLLKSDLKKIAKIQ